MLIPTLKRLAHEDTRTRRRDLDRVLRGVSFRPGPRGGAGRRAAHSLSHLSPFSLSRRARGPHGGDYDPRPRSAGARRKRERGDEMKMADNERKRRRDEEVANDRLAIEDVSGLPLFGASQHPGTSASSISRTNTHTLTLSLCRDVPHAWSFVSSRAPGASIDRTRFHPALQHPESARSSLARGAVATLHSEPRIVRGGDRRGVSLST